MANEIKPEQVPDAVIRQFATWQFPKCSENLMRRMLADALNAWPGAVKRRSWDGSVSRLILPMTENPND